MFDSAIQWFNQPFAENMSAPRWFLFFLFMVVSFAAIGMLSSKLRSA